MRARFLPGQVRLNGGRRDAGIGDQSRRDGVAQIQQRAALSDCLQLRNAARALMGFRNNLDRPKLHAADQSQTQMSYKELGDLLVGEIAAWKIESESLGSQPPAVGKLNVGVEMGAVLGHGR